MNIYIAVACLLITNTYAHRADTHAPIGVMMDHVHDKGEKMISLRHSIMNMKDLRRGPRKVSDSDYNKNSNKMGRPEEMQGRMTTLGLMYGVANKTTAVIMLPYLEREMSVEKIMSKKTSDMKSKGIGDIKLAMLKGLEFGSTSLALALGLSLPTGEITKEDNQMRLGYPMQLGSGSYEALLSATAIELKSWGSLGAQALSKLPLNDNKEGYRLGNYYEASLWASALASESLSFSLRLIGNLRSSTMGRDDEMHEMMSTLMDPEVMETQSIDYALGANLLLLDDHRLALEYRRRLSGWSRTFSMDLEDQWVLGYQKSF